MNAVANTENNALAVNSASSFSLLMDPNSLDRLERVADLMASNKTTVPAHLRGSKGDCFAIVLQAMQWGMNPFAVAQKTHLVNGTLGYEAQLVAAVINSSGAVKDRFKFEFYGPWEKVIGKFIVKKGDKGEYRVPGWTFADEEGCGVRVSATLKGETEPRVLDLLLAQARVRNSTLWADDPKQQLAYLGEKKWSRLYASDVILGVYTADELAEPGEKFMGPVDEVPKAEQPPTMFDPARFDKNLPEWRKAIAAGKAKAEGVIAKASTLGTLTDEQKEAIRAPLTAAEKAAAKPGAARPPEPVTDVQPKGEEAAPAANTGPAITFALVNDAMQKAPDIDALYTAADLIGEVGDPQQRSELTAIFEQRQAALGG